MGGNIADASTSDTNSLNATANYFMQPHGGPTKTYSTIYSGGGPITGLLPSGQATPVPGEPIQPLVPPVPPTLTRVPPIVPIVNTAARGVYFENTLVPVTGDGVNGPGAVPTPRLLTGPGKYVTIFIGTQT